ncbi:response regulator transcription factor [Burkholderia lata]|uniref:response regulator transcription factor n=1 Tax=Burkholderia lata (strain ATCC 17760 / DSM 23089 / LMG 22485 / NCIMB 9086 / R18194 / 383) TaxID=482957 RepID=UPI00158280F3|nr:response regulator transcription factor [Burkholderia lata]
MNILLIEDDPIQASAFERAFRNLDQEICRVRDGRHAVRFLRTRSVELVVLDWHLPAMSGIEVLHWIRTNLGNEPRVLFLTARVLETDVVAALEAGADAYIAKPFREVELAARVMALLRRRGYGRRHTTSSRIGAYVLDPAVQSISLRGETIELTAKEFTLARCLFENPGRLMSRDILESLAWGRTHGGTSRSLDTHIYRLRQKLMLRPENGLRLSAVYTHGYRLDEIDGMFLAADSAGSMKNGRREIAEDAHPVSRPGVLHAA